MQVILKALYKVGFLIWNAFIDSAVNLFTTSVKDSDLAGLMETAKGIFDGIIDCTIPLATLFFIIAIYKTVSSTPPEQQARKFMLDIFKYVMILYISSQLWNILGYVIDFTDGVTSIIADGSDYATIDTENNEVFDTIDGLDLSIADHGLNIGEAILDAIGIVVTIIVYLIGGVVSILVLASAGLTVIGVAFERIIKPLVILPFSTIVLGVGACSGEGERMMWHYGKTFLSFCISGAFMITAIKLGNAMFSTFNLAENINADGNDTIEAIVAIVQVDMTAIVITGLLKSMDSIVAKVFG